MITIFNRKELIITMEMKRQSEVRDILSRNGIDYTVKTTNLQVSSVAGCQRAHDGNFMINRDYSYEYRIYVHKKDFERAMFLIR